MLNHPAPISLMASPSTESVLAAILAETPHDEHESLCASWEALTPQRQHFLSGFEPSFVAHWLRGLLAGWDENASMNVLPEGGYARRVTFVTDSADEVHLWCLVASRSATTGELIHCHKGVNAPAGTVVAFHITNDGFARAGDMLLPKTQATNV